MKKSANIWKEYQKLNILSTKFNWKRINYPSRKDDWGKFEKIIQKMLLMFYLLKINLCPANISKHNSNHEKQIILLMILNGEV